MAELFHKDDPLNPQLICWDRKNFPGDFNDQLEAYKTSRTVYVGNLSFYTKESQILETFSAVGPVKRVIMGLNKFTQTPCGFCFVEYYQQEHAYAALKYVTETTCDDRIIRCDADSGFIQGRQFGRGSNGYQVRDNLQRGKNYDPARPKSFDANKGQARHSFGGNSQPMYHSNTNNTYHNNSSNNNSRKRGRDDDDGNNLEDREDHGPRRHSLDTALRDERGGRNNKYVNQGGRGGRNYNNNNNYHNNNHRGGGGGGNYHQNRHSQGGHGGGERTYQRHDNR